MTKELPEIYNMQFVQIKTEGIFFTIQRMDSFGNFIKLKQGKKLVRKNLEKLVL
jgi:hypothetical protein